MIFCAPEVFSSVKWHEPAKLVLKLFLSRLPSKSAWAPDVLFIFKSYINMMYFTNINTSNNVRGDLSTII